MIVYKKKYMNPKVIIDAKMRIGYVAMLLSIDPRSIIVVSPLIATIAAILGMLNTFLASSFINLTSDSLQEKLNSTSFFRIR